MAELLILVVIAGVVLLYAVDRTRKLRARARQMSGMNERLDVAAAKVDEQAERRQARVRASAELTSVLPAIRRPPLTLPGVPGSAAEPAQEPAAPGRDADPGRVIPDAAPAPERQVTPDGTMIMPAVPGQDPAPAGEAARAPAPSRSRASRPPGSGQPGSGPQSTSQEQANRD
jgi:hypothetical protein